MTDYSKISGTACIKLAFELSNGELLKEKKAFSSAEWAEFGEECRAHLLAGG